MSKFKHETKKTLTAQLQNQYRVESSTAAAKLTQLGQDTNSPFILFSASKLFKAVLVDSNSADLALKNMQAQLKMPHLDHSLAQAAEYKAAHKEAYRQFSAIYPDPKDTFSINPFIILTKIKLFELACAGESLTESDTQTLAKLKYYYASAMIERIGNKMSIENSIAVRYLEEIALRAQSLPPEQQDFFEKIALDLYQNLMKGGSILCVDDGAIVGVHAKFMGPKASITSTQSTSSSSESKEEAKASSSSSESQEITNASLTDQLKKQHRQQNLEVVELLVTWAAMAHTPLISYSAIMLYRDAHAKQANNKTEKLISQSILKRLNLKSVPNPNLTAAKKSKTLKHSKEHKNTYLALNKKYPGLTLSNPFLLLVEIRFYELGYEEELRNDTSQSSEIAQELLKMKYTYACAMMQTVNGKTTIENSTAANYLHAAAAAMQDNENAKKQYQNLFKEGFVIGVHDGLRVEADPKLLPSIEMIPISSTPIQSTLVIQEGSEATIKASLSVSESKELPVSSSPASKKSHNKKNKYEKKTAESKENRSATVPTAKQKVTFPSMVSQSRGILQPDSNAVKKIPLPIFKAAFSDNRSQFSDLFNRNNDSANATDEAGYGPLHYACASGSIKILQFYIEKNLDLEACSKNGTTPLMVAAFHGHLEMVKILYEQNRLAMNTKNANGVTPIMLAAEQEKASVVEFLLAREGIEIATRDDQGRSLEELAPTLMATLRKQEAEKNSPKVAKPSSGKKIKDEKQAQSKKTGALDPATVGIKITPSNLSVRDRLKNMVIAARLASGIKNPEEIPINLSFKTTDLTDVNSLWGVDENSALHAACANGDYVMAAYLIGRGANVNALSGQGLPPLFFAITHNDIKMVSLLLKHKANVNIQIVSTSGFNTPLVSASQYGYTEIVDLLLENGAETEYLLSDGTIVSERLNFLRDCKKVQLSNQLEQRLQSKKSELKAGVDSGVQLTYDEMVRRIPFVNQRLANSLMEKTSGSFEKFVVQFRSDLLFQEEIGKSICILEKFLLHAKGWPNKKEVADRLLCDDKFKKLTPQFVAASFDDIGWFEANSFDINAMTLTRNTVLHFACASGHSDLVKFFLERGADPTIITIGGVPPLFHVVIQRNVELTRLMVERKADVNLLIPVKDPNSTSTSPTGHTTLLILAASGNDPAMIDFLVDHGASLTTILPTGIPVSQRLKELFAEGRPLTLKLLNKLRSTRQEEKTRKAAGGSAEFKKSDNNPFNNDYSAPIELFKICKEGFVSFGKLLQTDTTTLLKFDGEIAGGVVGFLEKHAVNCGWTVSQKNRMIASVKKVIILKSPALDVVSLSSSKTTQPNSSQVDHALPIPFKAVAETNTNGNFIGRAYFRRDRLVETLKCSDSTPFYNFIRLNDSDLVAIEDRMPKIRISELVLLEASWSYAEKLKAVEWLQTRPEAGRVKPLDERFLAAFKNDLVTLQSHKGDVNAKSTSGKSAIDFAQVNDNRKVITFLLQQSMFASPGLASSSTTTRDSGTTTSNMDAQQPLAEEKNESNGILHDNAQVLTVEEFASFTTFEKDVYSLCTTKDAVDFLLYIAEHSVERQEYNRTTGKSLLEFVRKYNRWPASEATDVYYIIQSNAEFVVESVNTRDPVSTTIAHSNSQPLVSERKGESPEAKLDGELSCPPEVKKLGNAFWQSLKSKTSADFLALRAPSTEDFLLLEKYNPKENILGKIVLFTRWPDGKAIIEQLERDGAKPLSAPCKAAYLGDTAWFKSNPYTNSSEEAITPLHVACAQNKYDVAAHLLKNGASVDALYATAYTPLYFILAQKNTKLAGLLIDYKANVNIQFKVNAYSYTITPLLYTLLFDNFEMMDLLADRSSLGEILSDGDTVAEKLLYWQKKNKKFTSNLTARLNNLILAKNVSSDLLETKLRTCCIKYPTDLTAFFRMNAKILQNYEASTGRSLMAFIRQNTPSPYREAMITQLEQQKIWKLDSPMAGGSAGVILQGLASSQSQQVPVTAGSSSSSLSSSWSQPQSLAAAVGRGISKLSQSPQADPDHIEVDLELQASEEPTIEL